MNRPELIAALRSRALAYKEAVQSSYDPHLAEIFSNLEKQLTEHADRMDADASYDPPPEVAKRPDPAQPGNPPGKPQPPPYDPKPKAEMPAKK